jgi:hypothetical protein
MSGESLVRGQEEYISKALQEQHIVEASTLLASAKELASAQLIAGFTL